MRARSRRRERGAVYVEALVSMPLVFLFFLQVWQVSSFFNAYTILGHAAMAAARAGAVVGPDAKRFYNGEAVNDLAAGGARMDAVTMAAMMVVGASAPLRKGSVVVTCGMMPPLDKNIDPKSPEAQKTPALTPITGGDMKDRFGFFTAEVTAEYPCPWSWLNFICMGKETKPMRAIATFPYQDAAYDYGFGDGDGQ